MVPETMEAQAFQVNPEDLKTVLEVVNGLHELVEDIRTSTVTYWKGKVVGLAHRLEALQFEVKPCEEEPLLMDTGDLPDDDKAPATDEGFEPAADELTENDDDYDDDSWMDEEEDDDSWMDEEEDDEGFEPEEEDE